MSNRNSTSSAAGASAATSAAPTPSPTTTAASNSAAAAASQASTAGGGIVLGDGCAWGDASKTDDHEYTVARGRTVDGKEPGEKVKLNADDAERLFGLGFILAPDGSSALLPEGPAVNVEDGVQVKTEA